MRRAPLVAAAIATLVAASGCQIKDDGDNLVAGKTAFVQKCGSCHVLKRAGTTGVTGPDLDAAFAQSRQDGFGQSTFRGIVLQQIKHPGRLDPNDPVTDKPLPPMPANLVKGETAEDVAAYVASAVAKAGDDPGRLASIGVKRSSKVADLNADDNIPADPNGQLAYVFGAAVAKPGQLTIESTNKAPIDHNIAIEGPGVDQKGPIVKNGGTSKVSFDAKPGEYTFYCSVPGHREGGMVGKLTVK
jgi:plastocyanin